MNYKRITPEEEIELANIIQSGAHEADKAIEKFLHANLRLVLYQVSRLCPEDGDQQQDMIQEGNIGLITAIKKFDPKFGCRFSTYALWWVRQSIHRALEKDRTIKVPSYRQDMNRKIISAYQELGEAPTAIPQLCDYFGLPQKDIMLALKPCACTSLETPTYEGKTIMDMMSSEDNVEEALIERENQEILLGMLDALEKNQKIVLEMRYGLRGQECSSYQKIGETIGLSRTQVHQILSKTLTQLRKRADNMR